jgi:hypothetical protein
MESRVRYKKTKKDGILKSTRDLISATTGAKYRVTLDTINCTYSIYNLGSERSYKGGEGVNNLHVLKRHVKKRLEKLGVAFGKEIRDNSSRIPGVNCSYKENESGQRQKEG